jgi:transcription antitermination factor NusG
VDPMAELWIPTLMLGLGVVEHQSLSDTALIWQLLYTKPHAETRAELNLRRQGFATLLPRIRNGSESAPLFPRYIFCGHSAGQPTACLRSTIGVLDIVRCGEHPARVPVEMIEQIRSRMNAHSIVRLGEGPKMDPLFARSQRERVRALERLAAAGFRVRIGSLTICS